MLFMILAAVVFLLAITGFWLAPLPPPPAVDLGTMVIWNRLLVVFVLGVLAGLIAGWLVLFLAKRTIRYTPSTPQAAFVDAVRAWSWFSFAAGFIVAGILAVIMVWVTDWVAALGSEMVRYAIATVCFWCIVFAGAAVALLAYVVGATLSTWSGAYAFISHPKRS